jgi:hypothetical protein
MPDVGFLHQCPNEKTPRRVRDLQLLGWQTLNTALQHIREEDRSELLRLTLREVLGLDWQVFEKALPRTNPVRHLAMVEVLIKTLDDNNPTILLTAIDALISACRQIQCAETRGCTTNQGH